ncbi:MAG: hypothetical protein P4L51_18030 [Puia sp.]|nr:hypothetical protein [Puia sp.]
MNLNTIELSGSILAKLYGDLLVAPGETSLPAATPKTTTPKTAPSEATPTPAQTVPAKTKLPGIRPAESVSPKTTPPEPVPAETVPPVTAVYRFLGKNTRRISIVVQSPGNAYLPDDQLAFLSKMLEACKMNIGDVALVNHASAPVVIADFKTQLNPSIVILFGVGPVDIRLPMNFPLFNIQPYDECRYLCAPGLEELVKPTDEGKLLKSKLWVCLRNLFNV